MTAAIAACRSQALAIVTMQTGSSESLRRLAWRFLRQHRATTRGI